MKINFKVRHLYIIEYRFYDKDSNQWIRRTSSEGYTDIEEARNFCRERTHNEEGVTDNPMYYQNIADGTFEEYYIRDITFKDFSNE